MLGTVILKPTKSCNADCTYCCAPPDGADKWSLQDFKEIFDKLSPYLAPQAVLLWHGGEPTLMPTSFYQDCFDYARAKNPQIRFSMQTNLLGYSSRRWKSIFQDVFTGSISTSWDPDETDRLYKGSAKIYSKVFFSRFDAVLNDGFQPKLISTFSNDTIHLAQQMYSRAMAADARGTPFDIRINYRYPAGRDSGEGEILSPDLYGKTLIELFNKWIQDAPGFTITPLDQMFKKMIGLESSRCPWTHSCGGHFLGIEPDFTAFNCSEFADTGEEEFSFGNIKAQTVPELMRSRAARMIKKRKFILPVDCKSCRHFDHCEGGCMRDSVLYNRGLGGKFYYCKSWKMIFDRMREAVLSGEADKAIIKYRQNPVETKTKIKKQPASDFVLTPYSIEETK